MTTSFLTVHEYSWNSCLYRVRRSAFTTAHTCSSQHYRVVHLFIIFIACNTFQIETLPSLQGQVDNVSYAVPNRFLLGLLSSFCNKQRHSTPWENTKLEAISSRTQRVTTLLCSQKNKKHINQEQGHELEKATSARKSDPVSDVGVVTKVKKS